MILFDFSCPDCEEVFEELVPSDKMTHECPECSGVAVRMISTPRITLDGCSGDFPGAALKWEKVRRAHHTKGAQSDEHYK